MQINCLFVTVATETFFEKTLRTILLPKSVILGSGQTGPQTAATLYRFIRSKNVKMPKTLFSQGSLSSERV